MDYINLGIRGPRVSRIAFGNWSAGGDWGSVDRRAAIDTARQALDLGITFFDTARAYGFGAAEALLGEALAPELRPRREGIVIATKGGLSQGANGKPFRDASAGALRRDLEASLRSLGTDFVDLYQVHWPDPTTPFAESAEALGTFVDEGKVRFIGVSNYDSREMAAFQQTRPLDTLQPPYHLFRRGIEQSVLPFTSEHGIGVLVYGPLAHGLLTGRMTEATTFAPDDWRSKSAAFRGETFSRNLRIVDDLEAFAEAIADILLDEFAASWVRVRVVKPRKFDNVQTVGVQIERRARCCGAAPDRQRDGAGQALTRVRGAGQALTAAARRPTGAPVGKSRSPPSP